MENDILTEKDKLSEAKRILLERRLKGKRKKTSEGSEIVQSNVSNAPLSFTQERLWFVYSLDPESSAYNIPILLKFKGALNVQMLEKSIDEIIKHHASLRTNFKNIEGQPVQIISPDTRFELTKIDLRNAGENSKQEEAQNLIQKEVDKPFDLANDLLFRASLISLKENEHLLIINIQHIIFDGWSIDIFFNELSKRYESYVIGKDLSLPKSEIQYTDYAIWQRNYLKGKQYKKLLEYWKSQLADAPSVISLPVDHPRPKIQTYKGKTKSLKLPPDLYTGLKDLSIREGVTLYMTLLAVFKVFLYRYTAQEDFTVGTFIASRNRIEIENLIGFFANTLVMRTDIGDNPTFTEFLKRVREVSLGAHANQDMPFERLVAELQQQRNFSYNPLFQVMFDLQNEQVAKIENLEINSLPVHHSSSKFDLSLVYDELKEGLIANIEFNTDIFDESTIDRMLKHLQTLLENIVKNPEFKISEYSLVDEKDTDIKLISKVNDTDKIFPENDLIHTLFEEQVKKTPDADALFYEDNKISYKELNEKANQLARYFRKSGMKEGSLVGIYIDRSIDMTIGMLGVIKAGGAYVPLDPAYPKDRISYMLKDSNAEILLTQEKFIDGLPEINSKIVLIDSDREKIYSEDTDNLSVNISPEDVFNVIYTSGSTAKPKGVLNIHKSALNRFSWMWDKYPFEKNEICCQKTALSFVDSIWEIFGPLLKGITNVIIPDEVLKDPPLFAETLSKKNVTRIVLVPSLLNAMLESIDNIKNKIPKLKYWFTSGEALAKELAQKFEEVFDDRLLINLYGSSEVAADVTYYEVKNSKSLACIPIGKPIANTRIYILDKNLKQVPVGVVGELYVSGNNLSKGYLNQPDMTKEKFIQNPFEKNKAQMYKTGDLARYLPDGNIEYKGRVDQQVKIRGYRIELQEIETVLKENPGVADCIADVREFKDGDKRLVAYVIPDYSKFNSVREKISEISEEFSSQWKTVWEDTYKQSSAEDKTFNTIGWNSSYTGKPIPEEEMKVWLESTTERIIKLEPKRVLEIGVGTGMLLFRIASHSEKYVGTDISPESIKYLNEQLSKPEYTLPNVKLLEKKADDFSGFEENSFDTVIINSVVQYFPGIEYLYKVLEGAVKLVVPGGSIFIGDVRNFPLLEAFHTSVQLHHSDPSMTIEELKSRIEKNIENEKELVIDPVFFNDLKFSLKKIGYAEIEPKRGFSDNEVSAYRYDVTLHLEKEIETNAKYNLDWKKRKLKIENIKQILLEERPASLLIRNIPNERIAKDVKAAELLAYPEEFVNTGELKEKISKLNFDLAEQPENFWRLENEIPYKVNVSLLNSGKEGTFEVLFESKDQNTILNKNGSYSAYDSATSDKKMKQLSQYSNNPIQQEIANTLIPELRNIIRDKLPEYMIPSSFVLLDKFPLTPSGKLNRRALPVPEQKSFSKENKYVEPKDELELKLAAIWEKILDTKPIGIHDNFFELGGHSLMAVRLFTEIEKVFDKKLPLASLYKAQTIEALANLIRDEGWKSLWSSLVPIQTNGEKPPLFIVHGGGGNVLFCKDLVDFLDEDQPMYGLQSVGLDRSVEPLTSVEAMAEHYVKEIQTVQPEGPYYLAGNCFGGLITFEMARLLNAKGQKVALVVLIEAYNPSFSKLLPSKLQQGINDFKMGGFESIYKKLIWKISFHAFKLIKKPLPRALRSVVRANHRAYDNYKPKFYPDKITLFVASRSPAWEMEKPVFGWEELTDEELEVYKIQGGHLNIFEKHNIKGLAENLRLCLDKAMKEHAN